ncbi:MAG: DUF4153 domain-containing protein, partial [Tissierellia bacterium]|nr:DUF4153 domain-containing protein [Tissierellia bacterium]
MIERIKDLYKGIKDSLNRFPMTIIASSILVIMLIVLYEGDAQFSSNTKTVLQRISMITALGIPLSLCIKLIYEKRDGFNRVQRYLGWALGIAFLILYYFLLLKSFTTVSVGRYIGLSISLYLAFSYIPWIGRKKDFEPYIIRVLSSLFLTIIYSAVLYMGISAILFAIDQLLDIDVPRKFYYYSFLMVAGIFAPSSFLARIPKVDHDFEGYDYPRALKLLLVYIVIPLISIYSVILYMYFAKIIMTRNWPKGLVSHLVLWYSFISVAVIFFITPIIEDSIWARRFRIWFPRLNIPILIMMFMSIGIRIRAYGVTENRYFVSILGLWIFCIMLYFIMRKDLKNILIPLTLSIVSLNTVFGPLSSFAISNRSQNGRLEAILDRNNMLGDDGIIRSEGDISKDDRMEVSMILKYFDMHHSLEDVRYLEDSFTIGDMESVFGFSYVEKNIFDSDDFYIFNENREKALEIGGYDYLSRGYDMEDGMKLEDDITISYDIESNVFTIRDEKPIYTVDLQDLVSDIIAEYGHNNFDMEGEHLPTMDDLIFTDENDRVRVKFIINSISGGRSDQSGRYTFYDM